MVRRVVSGLSILTAAASLFGCWPGGAHGSSYGHAALALGAAVSATAIHRAATGDCWARCEPGLACDRDSGLCVKGGCDGGCHGNTSCTVTPTGFACVGNPLPSPLVYSGGARAPSPSAPGPGGQVQVPR